MRRLIRTGMSGGRKRGKDDSRVCLIVIASPLYQEEREGLLVVYGRKADSNKASAFQLRTSWCRPRKFILLARKRNRIVMFQPCLIRPGSPVLLYSEICAQERRSFLEYSAQGRVIYAKQPPSLSLLGNETFL